MIEASYVRTLAAYNAELNRGLYAAAATLSDADRRQDRGAFWGSIHGTFSHLLWADQLWMSRFAGWERPNVGMKDSPRLIDDFEALRAARGDVDERLSAWAQDMDAGWLAGDLTWFSGAAGREVTAPRGFLLVHFFNHQTHHRGQAHAMITAAGAKTADTDLFMVVAPPG